MTNREKLEQALQILHELGDNVFEVARFQASGIRYDLGKVVKSINAAGDSLKDIVSNVGLELR